VHHDRRVAFTPVRRQETGCLPQNGSSALAARPCSTAQAVPRAHFSHRHVVVLVLMVGV
jgi:hypothetical protein